MPWANDREARRRTAITYGPEYRRNRQLAAQRAAGRCERCGRRGRLQCDHIIPVTQGGTHNLANLQMLCSGPGSCHARKTATEGGGYRAPRQAADPEPAPRTAW